MPLANVESMSQEAQEMFDPYQNKLLNCHVMISSILSQLRSKVHAVQEDFQLDTADDNKKDVVIDGEGACGGCDNDHTVKLQQNILFRYCYVQSIAFYTLNFI